jgi:hypothetical protein
LACTEIQRSGLLARQERIGDHEIALGRKQVMLRNASSSSLLVSMFDDVKRCRMAAARRACFLRDRTVRIAWIESTTTRETSGINSLTNSSPLAL